MIHVAIMKKSWGLIPKILGRKKLCESRWYKNKVAPWGRIAEGDTVFFKNCGEAVILQAEVSKVLEFSGLDREKVREILGKYGKDDGIEGEDQEGYYELFKQKRYCLLIYLKDPRPVDRPFNVSKKGFGLQSAWMVFENENAFGRAVISGG
jgi:hypothetical protein